MRRLLITLALAACAGPTAAVMVVPTLYQLINGLYFLDDTYTGTGCRTCSGAILSGGLGDLTDGVVATANYNVNGTPYVGWRDVNPTVTFNFPAATIIDSVTISVDDTGGVSGVRPPSSVVLAGTTYPVIDPAGTAPFSFTINNVGFVGSVLPVTFVQSGTFVMVSEVAFAASPVSEPSTAGQFMAGVLALGALALRGRRRPWLRPLST